MFSANTTEFPFRFCLTHPPRLLVTRYHHIGAEMSQRKQSGSRKYVGVSGERIRCFTWTHEIFANLMTELQIQLKHLSLIVIVKLGAI
jgi:hypothetical protein